VPNWHLGKTVDEYSTPTFEWVDPAPSGAGTG